MNETQEFRAFAFRTRLAVWWGFVWRAFVITIGSTLAGAVAGGIVGFLAGMAGLAPGTKLFLVLTGGAGGLIGLYFVWLYVHWLFRANIAGFRLRLVKE